jgi:hypothetical protein
MTKVYLYTTYNSAAAWCGRAVLRLADDYTAGDLSALRSRFTLGSFVSGSTTTPITGYEIGMDGKLQATP